MTSKEFSEKAKLSAELYYEYIKDNDAGKSIIPASSKVTRDGHYFRIEINGKMRNLEDSYIRIDDPSVDDCFYMKDAKKEKYIAHEFLKICEYDELDKTIVIEATGDFAKIFNDIAPERIEFVSDLSFLVKNVMLWYKTNYDRLKLSSPPEIKKEEIFHRSYASVEQIAATNAAFENPYTYVWGAPGTGKTQVVLADCVMTYIDKELPVFILAPTNNALEQTLRAVISALKENGREIDCIFRLGAASTKFAAEYGEICERSDTQLKADRMSATIESLKNRLYEMEQAEIIRKAYDKYTDIAPKTKELNLEMERKSEKEEQLKKEVEQLSEQINSLNTTIRELKISIGEVYTLEDKWYFKLWKLFNTKKYKDKCEKRAICKEALDASKEKLSLLGIEKEEKTTDLNNISSELDYLDSQILENIQTIRNIQFSVFGKEFGEPYIEKEFKKLLDKYNNVVYDNDIEHKIEIREDLLKKLVEGIKETTKNKLVFGLTIDYFFAHCKSMKDTGLIPNKLAHFFLDEAAYCPMIKAGILFTMNLPVTFFGDHMQLPPVCVAPDKMVEDKATSLFFWAQSAIYFPEVLEKGIQYDDIFAKYIPLKGRNNIEVPLPSSDVVKTAFLPKTYRFGANLAKILDEFVYHNGFSGNEKFDTSITVIDSPMKCSINDKTNLNEAEAIKSYISNVDSDFVVTTPFKSQRKVLERKLKNVSSDDILTVHTSQGREWETVIISAVDEKPRFFLNSKLPIGLRVINTAISRAKKELIIVCNRESWLAYKDDQFLGRLVSSATKSYKFNK